jgi:hypothetical protein
LGGISIPTPLSLPPTFTGVVPILFAAAVGSDLSHPAPNTTQQQTMTKIRIDNTIFASTGMEQWKRKPLLAAPP